MSPVPEPPTSVGQQLRARRETLDLTQDELARRIGIVTPTVSVTERGHTEISLGKRRLWEKALHLKPGTISRAYREGAPIELAEVPSEATYADLSDQAERDIWDMTIAEEDRRVLIDAWRKLQQQKKRRGTA